MADSARAGDCRLRPGTTFARGHGIGLYWTRAARPRALSRSRTMGKVRQSNKEVKKKPLLTPKEKKAAKEAKKSTTEGIRPSTTR